MNARKKGTIRYFLDEEPAPARHQVIAKVVGPRGNNLHDVILPTAGLPTVIVELPPRFRNIIWVKRGSFSSELASKLRLMVVLGHYVIVEPFTNASIASDGANTSRAQSETAQGTFGTIEHIVFPNAIKTLKKRGVWPTAFLIDNKSVLKQEDDTDNDGLLAPNLNRQAHADRNGWSSDETDSDG